MRITRIRTLVGLALAAAAAPSVARAGGFDIPDQGTEALGRGGAFVAKSDSPLAMYYNVAGMAQQRGTRLLLDVNLVYHNMEFTRAGAYPGDPNDPKTPWAGKPYPTVSNGTPLGYTPFLGVTSDFGFFEKWTFGLGVFSPPGTSGRSYGVRRDIAVKDDKGTEKTAARYEVELPGKGSSSDWNAPAAATRAPSPTRFDTGDSSTLFLMPSLAAAFQPSKYLAIGVLASWVVGQAEITKASVYPGGKSTCGLGGDLPECDRYSTIHATLQTIGFNLSALSHPLPWLDVGLTYRPQINIDAHGRATPLPGWYDGSQLPPFPVTLSLKMPHIIRWGVRVKSHYLDGTERADLELDGTWENWSAQDYTRLRSYDFLVGKPIDPNDPNSKGRLFIDTPGQFKDTFSVRLGGAYNYRLSDLSRLIFRAGVYFDSATTDSKWTSVSSYGMAKYGMTAGLGVKVKGFTFDLAYAGVFMPERNVTDSGFRAPSSTNGTDWEPTDAAIYPNNGLYRAQIHMVSLGFTVNFSEYGRTTLYSN